jgi:hypothetical protein
MKNGISYIGKRTLTLQTMSKTPKYYIGKYRQIEALEVVLDFQEDNYNLGTAITYILRAGKKPNNPITQDIQKAIAHLQKELEHQTHISSNHLEYFEFHNASAKPKSDGMALLYKQSNQKGRLTFSCLRLLNYSPTANPLTKPDKRL